MPTTISFQRFFGKTPFPPMQDHMRLAVQCAEQIPDLLDALFEGDEGALKALKYKVFDLEREADKMFDQLSSELPRSMFMPVHRHDLVAVLRGQEAIANTSQDIAGMLALHLDITRELRKPLASLTNKGVETCQRALAVIEHLSNLVETGFKGPDVDRMHDLINEVDESEDGADVMGIDLTNALYLHHKDKDANAVSIVFTYQLISWLRELSDEAQRVGSRARLLVAR